MHKKIKVARFTAYLKIILFKNIFLSNFKSHTCKI